MKILSSFPTSFDDTLTVVATSAFTLTGLTVTPGIDVPTKAIDLDYGRWSGQFVYYYCEGH